MKRIFQIFLLFVGVSVIGSLAAPFVLGQDFMEIWPCLAVGIVLLAIVVNAIWYFILRAK